MSFRNRKALAFAMAVMLAATCMMFVIPESSDAAAAPAETVVIESDMDDDMPISDMILKYSAISAEKEHQESMGKDVIIRDNDPKRNDPNEQRFIDDMRHLIGTDDMFEVKNTENVKDILKDDHNSAPSDKNTIRKETQAAQPMVQNTQTFVPQKEMAFVAPTPADPMAVNEPVEEITADDDTYVCETSEEYVEETESADEESEEYVEDTESSDKSFEVIVVNEFSAIDKEFIIEAIELAEKYGVDLDMNMSMQTFMSKLSIAVMYSEICSIDNSPKDDSEESDDEGSPIIILEEDDEEPTVIPDEPEAIQDLFYTPVATVTVTDTLCSGTDI